MSFLRVPDGSALCVAQDGSALLTDAGGTDCLCRPLCKWYRFVRCGSPQCLPEGFPSEVYACLIRSPQEGETWLHAGQACFRWDGDVPRETLPEGATQLAPSSTNVQCGDPTCNQDLCGDWFLMTPCSGDSGIEAPVFAERTFVDAGNTVGVVYDTPGDPSTAHCYCVTGTNVRQLPPGARIAAAVSADIRNSSCCYCRFINTPLNEAPPCAYGTRGTQSCCCGRWFGLTVTVEGFTGPNGPVVFTPSGAFRPSIRSQSSLGGLFYGAVERDFEISEGGATVGFLTVRFFCGGFVTWAFISGRTAPPSYIYLMFTNNGASSVSCTKFERAIPFSSTPGIVTVEAASSASDCQCGSPVSPIIARDQGREQSPEEKKYWKLHQQMFGCRGCGQ